MNTTGTFVYTCSFSTEIGDFFEGKTEGSWDACYDQMIAKVQEHFAISNSEALDLLAGLEQDNKLTETILQKGN
jgi:hypothetical protein